MIWWLLQRSIFSAAVLLAVGAVLIHRWTMLVASTSMEPAIYKGAVVVYARWPPQGYRAGDVVVFADEKGRTIIHRVVSREEYEGRAFYITKGDASTEQDPPVPLERIKGKVFVVIPSLRTVI